MLDTLPDRRIFMGGALGLAAASVLPAWALSPAPPWPRVQSFLDDYVTSKRIPGGAASIGRGTDTATFLTSGSLARDDARPIDADSLFRVYSMTKPITGMAAMMLVDEGSMALDQNIADFLPVFAAPRVLIDPMRSLSARPAEAPITIRNLLTHTAGLGYSIVTKGPLLDAYRAEGILPFAVSRRKLPGVPVGVPAPSLEAFADRLATLPLIVDPGTRWSYSVGLDLMGRIIEIVAGMPFDSFLRKRLFGPLGMTSSFFQVPASELGRLTTNYGISPFGRIAIDAGSDSVFADKPAFPFGGAGLVMSPRDYDRFLLMLAGEGAIGTTRVMSARAVRLGMSNLLPPGVMTKGTMVEGQGFGAGGRVTTKAVPGGLSVGSYGWGGAAATIAWIDPLRRIRAAAYAQYMPDQTMPFTRDFTKSVYASL